MTDTIVTGKARRVALARHTAFAGRHLSGYSLLDLWSEGADQWRSTWRGVASSVATVVENTNPNADFRFAVLEEKPRVLH